MSEFKASYKLQKSIRESQEILAERLKSIGELLGLSDITYDYSLEANLTQMKTEYPNYEDERFSPIFLDAYLEAIHRGLKKIIDEDPSFVEAFNSAFTSKKIVVKPHPDPSSGGAYNIPSFSSTGDFVIEYKYTESNLDYICAEVVDILPAVDDVSYKTRKAIKDTQSKLDEHLTNIGGILGISNVTYDYNLKDNFAQMKLEYPSYADERFAEIYLDAYPKAIYRGLKKIVDGDSYFAEAFNSAFTSKKIVVKPHPDPSSGGAYNIPSFSSTGDFVIEYKYTESNLDYICDEVTNLL